MGVGRALPAFSYGVARTKKGGIQFFVFLFGRKVIIYRAGRKAIAVEDVEMIKLL